MEEQAGSEQAKSRLRRAGEALVGISLWLSELTAAIILVYLVAGVVVDELWLSAAVVAIAAARIPIRRWLAGSPWA